MQQYQLELLNKNRMDEAGPKNFGPCLGRHSIFSYFFTFFSQIFRFFSQILKIFLTKEQIPIHNFFNISDDIFWLGWIIITRIILIWLHLGTLIIYGLKMGQMVTLPKSGRENTDIRTGHLCYVFEWAFHHRTLFQISNLVTKTHHNESSAALKEVNF